MTDYEKGREIAFAKLDAHKQRFRFLERLGIIITRCKVEMVDDKLLYRERHHPSGLIWERVFFISRESRVIPTVEPIRGWKKFLPHKDPRPQETIREAIERLVPLHELWYIVTAEPGREGVYERPTKEWWTVTVHTTSRSTTIADEIRRFDKERTAEINARNQEIMDAWADTVTSLQKVT